MRKRPNRPGAFLQQRLEVGDPQRVKSGLQSREQLDFKEMDPTPSLVARVFTGFVVRNKLKFPSLVE